MTNWGFHCTARTTNCSFTKTNGRKRLDKSTYQSAQHKEIDEKRDADQECPPVEERSVIEDEGQH